MEEVNFCYHPLLLSDGLENIEHLVPVQNPLWKHRSHCLAEGAEADFLCLLNGLEESKGRFLVLELALHEVLELYDQMRIVVEKLEAAHPVLQSQISLFVWVQGRKNLKQKLLGKVEALKNLGAVQKLFKP